MNPKPGTTVEGTAWAVRLMKREASGESIDHVSVISWREALGFSNDTTAKQALEVLNKTRVAT